MGLRDADVIPVLKHFPGLGSATGNTDFESAKTPPLYQLKKNDLKPYESLLLDSPVAVMTTNAIVPGLSAGEPASLSPATYDLLRDEYGFTGVVMTDSLSAAATTQGRQIRRGRDRGDHRRRGCRPVGPIVRGQVGAQALRKAVASGKLTEEQVNESVARILDLKGVDLCEGR